MRKLEQFGPQNWHSELLEKVASEKEDNQHDKVDEQIVAGWHKNLESSKDADGIVVRRILG